MSSGLCRLALLDKQFCKLCLYGWKPQPHVDISSSSLESSSETLVGSPSLWSLVANILIFLCHSHHLFHLFYTSFLPLIAEPFSSINFTSSTTNWTRLPTLCPYGSKRKSVLCTGYLLPVDSGLRVHMCLFSKLGFTIKSQNFQPCNVLYHASCIKVGAPFRSRHFGKGTNGLQYPPCGTNLPFICELCTTRTHLGRELDPHSSTDMTLLILERMRMIDAAHAWAPRTLENACRTLRKIDKFFTSHYGRSLN